MFRFADVPLSLSGMTRIHGQARLFARADHGGLGRNGPSCGPAAAPFSRPGSRPGPTIRWAATISAAACASRSANGGRARPTACSSSQRQAPAGRRHQSQQRAPRRRPGRLGRLLDGPALCRAGADDRRAARDAALRVRRAAPAPARGRLPAAQRALQGACWPRSASTRKGWRASICGSTASGPTTCCSPCCAPTTMRSEAAR